MSGTHTRRAFVTAGLAALPAWAMTALAGSGAKSARPFKLGIICDEISEDFAEAAKFLASYSLHYCDLRELWSKNIMNLSQEELTRARDILHQHGLRVTSIASPAYKYDLPEMPAKKTDSDMFRASFTDADTGKLLERTAELAHFFDTKLVRIFSYFRVEEPEKAYPYVRDRLAKAAEFAGRHGIIFALENEQTCNVGTGRELSRIVKEIHSPHLRGNWDAANSVLLGETPYPDGYQAVRGLFPHMHVKDLKKNPQTGKFGWVPVGEGVIDFHGLFKALKADKYRGTMSLETHYRRADGNRLESTRESLEGWLKVLREI